MDKQKIYDRFKRDLAKDGLKLTPQRIDILNELLIDDSHRECEEIYLDLRKNDKKVSRATVYRTMEVLVKNGFARKLELGDGKSRYESKINSPHHDHLICISCSKIVEFLDNKIEDLQIKIAHKNKFTLTKHIHHLYGKCEKCQ